MRASATSLLYLILLLRIETSSTLSCDNLNSKPVVRARRCNVLYSPNGKVIWKGKDNTTYYRQNYATKFGCMQERHGVHYRWRCPSAVCGQPARRGLLLEHIDRTYGGNVRAKGDWPRYAPCYLLLVIGNKTKLYVGEQRYSSQTSQAVKAFKHCDQYSWMDGWFLCSCSSENCNNNKNQNGTFAMAKEIFGSIKTPAFALATETERSVHQRRITCRNFSIIVSSSIVLLLAGIIFIVHTFFLYPSAEKHLFRRLKKQQKKRLLIQKRDRGPIEKAHERLGRPGEQQPMYFEDPSSRERERKQMMDEGDLAKTGPNDATIRDYQGTFGSTVEIYTPEDRFSVIEGSSLPSWRGRSTRGRTHASWDSSLECVENKGRETGQKRKPSREAVLTKSKEYRESKARLTSKEKMARIREMLSRERVGLERPPTVSMKGKRMSLKEILGSKKNSSKKGGEKKDTKKVIKSGKEKKKADATKEKSVTSKSRDKSPRIKTTSSKNAISSPKGKWKSLSTKVSIPGSKERNSLKSMNTEKPTMSPASNESKSLLDISLTQTNV